MDEFELIRKARAHAREWDAIADLLSFAADWCDDDRDRMYRGEDQSWWKRVGNEWVEADAPLIAKKKHETNKKRRTS